MKEEEIVREYEEEQGEDSCIKKITRDERKKIMNSKNYKCKGFKIQHNDCGSNGPNIGNCFAI